MTNISQSVGPGSSLRRATNFQDFNEICQKFNNTTENYEPLLLCMKIFNTEFFLNQEALPCEFF